MALPIVSLNYAQWGFAPAALNVADPFLMNLRVALELSLTGLTNLLYADDAGTIDLSVSTTDPADIRAYERAPDPGPSDADWRSAQDQALLLKGGSLYGMPLNFTATRFEGRPEMFSAAEVIGL